MPPLRQGTHQQTIASLRSTLGADAFSTAWEAGRALSVPEVRAYVLTLTEADAIHASARGDEG